MLLKIFEEELNTEQGPFLFHVFRTVATGKQIWVYETKGYGHFDNPLVRIQFGCSIGIISRGRNCDCNQQFETSLQEVSRSGKGLVIYLYDDDGRGIGLEKKLSFLNLQNQLEKPPIHTAHHFHLQYEDFSTLNEVPELLDHFGIGKRIRLLTNSPQKVQYMQSLGLDITERQNLYIDNDNLAQKAKAELQEKLLLLGHQAHPAHLRVV